MYGRPGLVRRRPLLRAAAVGGTFAAGRAMGRRAAEQASADAYQDQRISDLEGQQNQPLLRSGDQGDQDQPLLRSGDQGDQDQPLLRSGDQGEQNQSLMQAAPQGTGPASAADQLGKLAELHHQGALTDEEFAAAKAKILGSS
jgi:Short C-terminal domain